MEQVFDYWNCYAGRRNRKDHDRYAWFTIDNSKKAEPSTIHAGYLNLNYPAKVIYNPPATIIIWPTGDKTVVKCCEDDIYDPMTGFLLCCLKHCIGADNNPAKFHRFLKDFGPKPEQYDSEDPCLQEAYARLNKATRDAAISVGNAAARIMDGIAKAFGGSDKGDSCGQI